MDELVTVDEAGASSTVADTRGEFSSFGFRPPSLNNVGDVAFLANLDGSSDAGIFLGQEEVISTGETLDGETVTGLRFCEEGLSDAGELAFVADFQDPDTVEVVRTAVYRASPPATPAP